MPDAGPHPVRAPTPRRRSRGSRSGRTRTARPPPTGRWPISPAAPSTPRTTSPRVHDRRGEPGAQVEVGERAVDDPRPHSVVRPERRRLDVVLDGDGARPARRSRPPARSSGVHPEVDGVPHEPVCGSTSPGMQAPSRGDRPAPTTCAIGAAGDVRRRWRRTSCCAAPGGRRRRRERPRRSRRGRRAAVLVPPMSMPSLTTPSTSPMQEGNAARAPRRASRRRCSMSALPPCAGPTALDDARRRGPPRASASTTASAGWPAPRPGRRPRPAGTGRRRGRGRPSHRARPGPTGHRRRRGWRCRSTCTTASGAGEPSHARAASLTRKARATVASGSVADVSRCGCRAAASAGRRRRQGARPARRPRSPAARAAGPPCTAATMAACTASQRLRGRARAEAEQVARRRRGRAPRPRGCRCRRSHRPCRGRR